MALDQDALDALRRASTVAVNAPPRRRWLPWLIAALVVIAALIGWRLFGSRPLAVTTATALALPDNAAPAAVLDASGFVVARRQATVSAKVTGKVLEVEIEEGMSVRKGQVLARLDPSQATLAKVVAERQITAGEGSLNEVKVRLADARRTLERNEKLLPQKLVSQAAVDTARADVEALEAEQLALQGQLDVYRSTSRVRDQDLEDLVIRAPFDGVVISKDAQPGEMISPISAGGGFTRTGIATMVDMSSREIEVDVNESFINRVHDGQRAEAVLDAYPDWTIPAHVISIVPAADRQKATVKVRIAFDQLEARILPDMGVKVRFLGEAETAASAPAAGRNAVLVPAEAVVTGGGASFVWVLDQQRARRTPVTTGGARGNDIEVTSGLTAGTVIISPPARDLTDGARVQAGTP